jgi:hypothetical protein
VTQDESKQPDPKDNFADEAERKERVLHTRVPESLDDAIRAAASELGMSVSNLVRNVLANALDVVEAATMQVPKRAAAVAATVRGSAAAAEPGGDSGGAQVLGWQEATLNVNAVCDRCNALLPRGTRAAISVTDRPAARRPFLCLACLEEVSHDAGA